jgi:hypothetical protein
MPLPLKHTRLIGCNFLHLGHIGAFGEEPLSIEPAQCERASRDILKSQSHTRNLWFSDQYAHTINKGAGALLLLRLWQQHVPEADVGAISILTPDG